MMYERRKAAAFKWIEDLGVQIPYDIMYTLHELTKPSPPKSTLSERLNDLTPDNRYGPVWKETPVADGDVDAALAYFKFMFAEGEYGSIDRHHLNSLISAAQHPQREEWLDISSAPRDMTQVILYAYAASTSDHLYYVGYFSKGIWLSADDVEQFHNPTHWLPLETLPSPPKAEK